MANNENNGKIRESQKSTARLRADKTPSDKIALENATLRAGTRMKLNLYERNI